ncbi:MAG: FimB/Mfa2 family fimbrial subunit [Muribaculaceae bacterium]|nr:FimB/Mfa2 family fimbrial subunit [Muribaculaceae bacterium]
MKKNFLSYISNPVSKVFMAFLVAAGLTACDNAIYDFDEDCPPEEIPGDPSQPGPANPEPGPGGFFVKFVFERNMQFVDGFSEKVNSVDLYVFNQSGAYLTKYHEEGLPLKSGDYEMELTDLPAGSYEFVAWCGLANNNGHFSVPGDLEVSRNHHVTCTMATNSDADHSAYQNVNLAPLFHGRNDKATYVNNNEKQVQTVYLTKNTNNVNLTLQHKDGLEFDKDRFTVLMHDNNDFMQYDNAVPVSNQEVQYRPYRTALGTTVNNTRTRADENSTTGNYMQIELSTARLMTENNPTITVTDNETGKTIFSIPLVKWALQLRSSNYKDMDPQEYLDREDNYNLMLWLDNDEDGWFGAEIQILDWHVIDDETTAN